MATSSDAPFLVEPTEYNVASARPGLAEQCPSDPRSLVLPLVQEKVMCVGEARRDMGAAAGSWVWKIKMTSDDD